MRIKRSFIYWFVVYVVVLGGFSGICIYGNKAVTAFNEIDATNERMCIIVDAGHGGVDGGTTSCTGVKESAINLEIALRLNDFLHLLGINTKMIRTSDTSVYTEGETIAAKKVSDLKERVRIVQSTPNSLLISIHQNYFSESQYTGAQVFYGNNKEGIKLADAIQQALIHVVNPQSTRSTKKAANIYLMEHITRPGVLIECGFLSNPKEEALLRDEVYQKKLCGVIGCTLSEFINSSSDIT